ncbi:MAG: MerR family transcriptional regulator [Tyzzerella sp.]|nr:MerR family transcriptional regulator [Tyzzerella sp.]
MGEVHYMISEAAKRVSVETHVLRYWEEELDLTIGRTEMGHRYYTEEDVQLFNCIKELKEQGMLLKDLKNLIPDMLRTRNKLRLRRLEAATNAAIKEPTTETHNEPNAPIVAENTKKLTDLQEALLANNKLLETSISQAVSKAVITEMDFLLQAKERQEEERYKKLDCLIRQQQTLRRESARPAPFKNFRRLFEA